MGRLGSEREWGWYRWLRHPYLYDAVQWLVRGRRAREEFVARFVRAQQGDRILDIGCGTATVLQHLPAVTYTGIDSNAMYIQFAERRFGSASTRFICDDVSTALENEEARFDVVIALGVMHHLADHVVGDLCRQVSRLLTPGGRFVTHDPVLTPDQNAMARWFVEHDRGNHVRTEEALLALMRSAGLNARSTITHSSLRIPYSEVMVEATAV